MTTASSTSPFARLVSALSGVPVHAWLILLVIGPNLLLIAVSFLKAQGGVIQFSPNLDNYTRLMGSEAFWVLLGRTIATATAASLIATVIAFPTAWYASRKLRKGRMSALVLVVLPLWISLLMRVFAWKVILGEKGVLNSWLLSLGVIDHPSDAFLYTTFSVLLAFVYISIPFVFVATHSALDRIPHNLVEAASDCGANSFQTFWRVIWPLARPGAAIGFVLAFLLCVGDYITPSMVGGLDGTMLGMVIASQFGLAGNWPYGAATAIVLMSIVALILGVILLAARTPGVLMGEDNGSVAASTPPKGAMARLMSWGGFGLFCLPYAFLYMPLVLIVLFSFNDAKVQVFPLTGFTTKWYAEVFANGPMLAALLRSLEVGLIVLALSIVAGTGFAVLFAYGKVKGGKAVEMILALPVAIPGVILGITMVLACQFLKIPTGLPRVVIGHSTFVMPVIMMIVLTRLRRLDPALMEAAQDCGASRLRAFIHVLLPLIGGSILGGALLGFTLSVDEVVITLFLTGAEPTLPVWVWNQMRFGFTPSVNAIFTLIGGTTLFAVIVAERLSRSTKT